ncbi:DnaT-like ssDNA-binding domain-containing protein [Motiliproteus sp.]|uniref:DnaT-like ssDNA-binding domain-containing protein n=1 Tax=Motiliproteus sp. TaxID=1898955 RepID=UPI003BAAD271
MSSLFPESPILFYPSLGQRFGAEPALLLAIYHQYLQHHGAPDSEERLVVRLRRREWLLLAPFWDEDRLAQLTSELVGFGVIEAQFQANGAIQLMLPGVADQDQHAEAPAPAGQETLVPDEPQSIAPSMAETPARNPDHCLDSEPSAVLGSSVGRGPAPSFGGSTGWARPKDDLERLFERQERQKQQLAEIAHDWQPGADTLRRLAKNNISEAFALACVDQFVTYYLGQGKRKTSWEQPFMKWVSREWISAQQQQYRQHSQEKQQGSSGERDQTRARQDKRERITRAAMDIHNTDW